VIVDIYIAISFKVSMHRLPRTLLLNMYHSRDRKVFRKQSLCLPW